GAARSLQANQLGEAQIGGEEMAAPAGEALLQRIAELRIEARELFARADPLAIGRIGDHHARLPRRRALQDVRALQPHPTLPPRPPPAAASVRFASPIARGSLSLPKSWGLIDAI